jgi:uncharacterized membrane protein
LVEFNQTSAGFRRNFHQGDPSRQYMEPRFMDVQSFELTVRPNRSLSVRGRHYWLSLIALAVAMMATAAILLGAWPVLPFAGLEIFLVWVAFRVVERDAADYESLHLTKNEFRWEIRRGKTFDKLAGNCDWAEFDVSRAPRRELQLRYGSKRVQVGRLMTDAQRVELVSAVVALLGIRNSAPLDRMPG